MPAAVFGRHGSVEMLLPASCGGEVGMLLKALQRPSHETGPLRMMIGAEARNRPEPKGPPSWKKTPPVSCRARGPLNMDPGPLNGAQRPMCWALATEQELYSP